MRIELPFRSEPDWLASADRVAGHLARGGLLVHPTETVYGIGCALYDDALTALAELKARQGPFLVLVHEAPIERTIWPEDARVLAEAFWPGPLTIIVPARSDSYPGPVLGPRGTVAVRATSHPGMQAVLRALDGSITSTSANRPGSAPEVAFDGVRVLLDRMDPQGSVWLLDGGDLPPAVPSTLVDCSSRPPRVLRKGAVSIEALREVIDGVEEA